MNISRIIFCTICFSLMGALCCTAAIAGGYIKAHKKEIFIGEVKEGPAVEKHVKISNTGDKTFTITNVRTSCACTTCKFPKKTIQPGETIVLDIVYETYKFPGKFDKTIHIETDIPDHTEEVIHLKGYVDPMPMGKIELASRKIKLQGLKAGEPHKTALNLKNVGDAPYTVTKIYSARKEVVYFEGEVTVEPGKSEQIEISVMPRKSGRFLDIIWIVSGDARNTTEKGYKAILLGQAS